MSSIPSTTHPAVAALGALRRHATRSRLSSSTSWALACLAVDGAMLAAAAAATVLGSRGSDIPATPGVWLLAFAILVVLLARIRGMHALRLRLEVVDDLRGLVAVTSLAAMIVLSARFLLGDTSALAAEVVRPWAFATVYLLAGRAALYWSVSEARLAGESARPTLIVGAGSIGRLAAKRLLEHPELGLKPIGFLDKEPLEDGQPLGLPVLGRSWDLDHVVKDYGVEQVVVTFSTAPHDVLLRLVRRCEEVGVGVFLVPRLFETMTQRLTIDHVGALPLLSARTANPKSWQFAVKYAADQVIAAVLLILLLPILACSALAVVLSLGRPILFRQERIGRDGRRFAMLKFRSMRIPADAEIEDFEPPDGAAPGGVEGSDRRTGVGTFLRRTCLDELPQLLNVVRGEMSLVGPRPERPEYVTRFERDVHRYADRHRVKSGITGWAQVNGLRGQTSLADRVEWDNYYIENWSLWLDVKILLFTARSVVKMYRQAE
jgi:exopolysaccharide biosynthesis polyprenyl glycosylphosphotransferase